MLQKEVTAYKDILPGYPGQIAKASVATVTDVFTVFDSANPIVPGDFLIGEVDNATKDIKFAKLSKGNIQNKPILGVVIENNIKIGSQSRLSSIPNGHTVTALKKGAVFVKATSDATYGYYVHLKNADGAVVYDQSPTKNDHTFTGFQVTKGGKKNEMVVIERV